jgi:hypothetical protein
MEEASGANLTEAVCVDCGKQLTVAEFRASRGMGHRCEGCRQSGGHTAAAAKPKGKSKSKHWTGREKLVICTVCDEGIRKRERWDGEWVAYEEDEDRRHRHRG